MAFGDDFEQITPEISGTPKSFGMRGFDEERKRLDELLERYGVAPAGSRSILGRIDYTLHPDGSIDTFPSPAEPPMLPGDHSTPLFPKALRKTECVDKFEPLPEIYSQELIPKESPRAKDNYLMKIRKPYQLDSYPLGVHEVMAVGMRIIQGVALEQEAQIQACIAEVREAIADAGLADRALGQVGVFNPHEAHTVTEYPHTIGGAITNFYVSVSDADQILAIADQIRRNRDEEASTATEDPDVS